VSDIKEKPSIPNVTASNSMVIDDAPSDFNFNIFADKKEPVVKDIEPKMEIPKEFNNISTEVKNDFSSRLPEVKEEPNRSIRYNSDTVDDFNVFNSDSRMTSRANEISIGNEKANIAVATSSPMDDDFEYDSLPKVENASIIQPSYNSGTVVKTSENSDYNIYNNVPNLMENIKNDIKIDNVVKEETKEFVDSIEISKDKLSNVTNKLNEYNVYNTTVKTEEIPKVVTQSTVSSQPIVEKTNVNVDPDKIVINSNSPISDDAFFDDFFGDDE
jgi:hypothetical protein